MKDKLANRRRRGYAEDDGGSPAEGIMPESERWPEASPEKTWFILMYMRRGKEEEDE